MRACFILALLILSMYTNVAGQSQEIRLSRKHQKKVERLESGHKRMLAYYKFYKQDSARHAKKLDRHYQRVLDSVWRVNRKRQKLIPQPGHEPAAVHQALGAGYHANETFLHWRKIFQDSSITDSARLYAKGRMQALASEQMRQNPNFERAMQQYQLGADSVDWRELSRQVPALDTLSGLFDSSPRALFSSVPLTPSTEGIPLEDMQGYAAGGKMPAIQKNKAVEEAVGYFSEHPELLGKAQKSVSKLMAKYSSYTNSQDLGDAVKRTSLKGKSFTEHLLMGANIQPVSTKPFSVDLAPAVGYKFTTRFAVGLGVSYRVTFGDSIRNDWYVSTHSTSFRLFSAYDIVRSFFAYGEWNKTRIKSPSPESSRRSWKDDYFIGVGKKILIHPKLYFTVTALYNLNNDDQNPVFLRRFQLRVGFQISELATRKPKMYYDPHR